MIYLFALCFIAGGFVATSQNTMLGSTIKKFLMVLSRIIFIACLIVTFILYEWWYAILIPFAGGAVGVTLTLLVEELFQMAFWEKDKIKKVLNLFTFKPKQNLSQTRKMSEKAPNDVILFDEVSPQKNDDKSIIIDSDLNSSQREPQLERLRVIKTARDEKRINEAAKKGFWPLIKKIEPSDKIRSKYAVVQHKKTGEIHITGDYRMGYSTDENSEYKAVIGWTYYYPHYYKSPFAAYLIPKDIEVGERVFVQDLIEDYIGARWSQGSVYRLRSCEAIWNGKDLEIQYDPNSRSSYLMG